MEPPTNTELPYFAYGLFKPGELAYNQIQEFVNDLPKKVVVNGSLFIRDGLPLLRLGTGGEVMGYLIEFKKNDSIKAYEIISRFEPKEQYKWYRQEFPDKIFANLLIGHKPRKGSVSHEKNEWKAYQDPVFNEAMILVLEIINEYAINKFDPAPPDRFDWKRLFRLQMAYLLLWTAVERFCALAYGPSLNPGEKLQRLGREIAFKKALKYVVKRNETVFDSRDIGPCKLNPDNPSSSVNYYYRIRSNLSHRGKGAWKDGEIVRLSLKELAEIFKQLLVANGLYTAHDDKL
jgi:hypothetical protein